jgi:hypothetical protein
MTNNEMDLNRMLQDVLDRTKQLIVLFQQPIDQNVSSLPTKAYLNSHDRKATDIRSFPEG